MANLKVQIDPKDLKRIQAKLNNLKQYVGKDVIQDVLYQNANLVVNEMKREVPVDTGRLKRNIHASKDSRGVTIESEALTPSGRKYDYAPYIEEYGGRFSKGVHYFSRGLNRFVSRVMKDIRQDVKAILTKASGATRQRGKVRTFTPRK